MKYVNLTGHEVHNLNSGLKLPAGEALRIDYKSTKTLIDGQMVHETKIVGINLPDPEDNTIYIVSALALGFVPNHRKDVWCPKQVVRKNGKIIGCKDFRRKED